MTEDRFVEEYVPYGGSTDEAKKIWARIMTEISEAQRQNFLLTLALFAVKHAPFSTTIKGVLLGSAEARRAN